MICCIHLNRLSKRCQSPLSDFDLYFENEKYARKNIQHEKNLPLFYLNRTTIAHN